MRLADLQMQMQNAVMKDTGFAQHSVAQPPRGTPEQAFGVYRHAYQSRHTEFLANDYPMLRKYLGEVRFNAMAADYIESHPSRHANARWYSSALPEFLQQFPGAPPGLAELATLEKALADAFDSPDIPSAGLNLLAEIPPEAVQWLRFDLHPSFQLIEVKQNTTSIWSAMKCDEVPPRSFELESAQTVMVWRQNQQSRMRILGEDERMAIMVTRDGASFGTLCEMLVMRDPEEDAAFRAASYLRGWLEAELLTTPVWTPA